MRAGRLARQQGLRKSVALPRYHCATMAIEVHRQIIEATCTLPCAVPTTHATAA